jgi:hypothetical protein
VSGYINVTNTFIFVRVEFLAAAALLASSSQPNPIVSQRVRTTAQSVEFMGTMH